MHDEQTWLSLSEAAAQLGVHSTTLRRWVDHGAIAAIVTAGGHRRFDPEELERFARMQRQARPKTGIPQVWQQHALRSARHSVSQQDHMHWLEHMPEQIRDQNRQLGRRLLGLLMTYISLDDGGEEILQEAHAIGHSYATSVASAGLSLLDAMQALQFYRDMMIEAAVEIVELARVRPDRHVHLVRRMNTLLNTVQLALVSAYQSTAL